MQLNSYVCVFVMSSCPVCRRLSGYIEGDDDLKSLFTEDCKLKHILIRQMFDLSQPQYGAGRVWFDRLRRGAQVNRDLGLRRAKPDARSDVDTKRFTRVVRDYGIEYVRQDIFVDRVEFINIAHPANKHYAFRYQLKAVPTVLSPYAQHGIFRGLPATETELEIERLLFVGGYTIKPAEKNAQAHH